MFIFGTKNNFLYSFIRYIEKLNFPHVALPVQSLFGKKVNEMQGGCT